MPNYAVIVDEKITNVIDIEDPHTVEDLITENGWIPLPIGFGIGDGHAGGCWAKAQPLPTIIPQSITMVQCRLKLLALGVLDDVEKAIMGMSKAAQIEWEYRTSVSRSHALVLDIATFLRWSLEQTDTYFLEASLL
ncbi:MAG: hypothetical protein HKK66_03175 [Chlorobiaceae bacterium]|nr:hypothetical protein [Chlorobiaceae bacterium]